MGTYRRGSNSKRNSQKGGGQYKNIGNILLNDQYALITINTPCVVLPNTRPLLVIVIRLKAVQLGNLVWANRKALQDRKEWLNIEREVKKKIQEAFPPGEISGMQDLHHGFKNT